LIPAAKHLFSLLNKAFERTVEHSVASQSLELAIEVGKSLSMLESSEGIALPGLIVVAEGKE
jgi:hypothetical protein